MCTLEGSDKDFALYSECKEKTLSFKKTALEVREITVGALEWKQPGQLRGGSCRSPRG